MWREWRDRIPVLVLSLFVAVAVGQAASALAVAYEAYNNDRRGLPGSVLRMDLSRTLEPLDESARDPGARGREIAERASKELRQYLDENSIGFVLESSGEGYPMLTVWDGCQCIEWWHGRNELGAGAEPGPVEGAAFLVEGSYSAVFQDRQGRVPYGPPGQSVVGRVNPGFESDMQAATVLGELPTYGSRVTINNAGVRDVGDIDHLLLDFELQISNVSPVRFRDYFTKDAVVAPSILFSAAALLVSMLHVWGLTRAYREVLTVSFRVGATPTAASLRWIRRNAVAVAGGTAIGALVPLLLRVLAQSGLPPGSGAGYVVLVVVLAGSLVLLWGATYYLGAARKWRRNAG